jgi:hypothetical protein
MESIASTLGFYNFLSYIIPGLLYLYVINGFAQLFRWQSIDITTLFQNGEAAPGLLTVVVILLGGFVVAQLLEPIANFIFHKLFVRRDIAIDGFELFRKKNNSLEIKFKPTDFELLFTIIRQRNTEIARPIEQFQAQSIMFRNLSFGLLLLSILEIASYFEYQSIEFGIIGLLALWMSWIAHQRSNKFRIWFFERIFEASMDYGNSIEKVVAYRWNEKTNEKQKNK